MTRSILHLAGLAPLLLFLASVLAPQTPPAPEDAAQECELGRDLLEKRTFSDVQRAIEHFRRALEVDPDHAPAYAGLADAYALIYEYDRAEEMATRALELDDSQAGAHASLGFIRMHARWDWVAAGRHFERALTLDPDNAQTHHWYAIWLEVQGRHEEAISEGRTALSLEPESVLYSVNLGYRLYWARRYDEAIEQFEATLRIDPSVSSAHYFWGRCLVEQGRYEQAKVELERAAELDPANMNVSGAMGYLAARWGRRKEANRLLAELESAGTEGLPFASHIASIHLALGHRKKALEWLERALAIRGVAMAWLGVDPRFDALRSDARFVALLHQIGL